jgi:phytoene synthase
MLSETVQAVPDSAYRQCEEIARQHGRTFYFASRWLPAAQRRAILATYAWCRIADDIVDAAPDRGADRSLASLMNWQRQLGAPTDPVALAFAASRKRFAIPIEPVLDLLTGVRMDLDTFRYVNWSELHTYCYRVAGTVGLMVAPILGCRDQAALVHAAELGIAMQLTNILRDVGEDAQLGRLYLPLDEIARFGCDPDSILAGTPGQGFRELMQFQIARARSLYASARHGVPALDSYGRFTTLLAGDLYARILNRIEAVDYDVFQSRAHCSTTRKLFALPGITSTFVRLSMTKRTFQSDGSVARLPIHAGEVPDPAQVMSMQSDTLRSGNQSYG